MRLLAAATAAMLALLGLSTCGPAQADQINGGTGSLPGQPGSPGGGGQPGSQSGENLSPGSGEALFLCPGVGAAATSLGAGGGYCDFDFRPNAGGHVHCEWGGLSPVVQVWNCWRVFKGQPDHPAHPDPDIIPDGFGVPWAITGPTPGDQWPPPGLAPAGDLGPPAGPPGPFGPPPAPPP
jgi:hypothetical protein